MLGWRGPGGWRIVIAQHVWEGQKFKILTFSELFQDKQSHEEKLIL
jgi:hypothetical protein